MSKNNSQELFRQTQPKKGRFANRFAKTVYFCECGVFSLNFPRKKASLRPIQNIGAIRVGGVLVSSRFFSRKNTPNTEDTPFFPARKSAVVWFAGTTPETQKKRTSHQPATRRAHLGEEHVKYFSSCAAVRVLSFEKNQKNIQNTCNVLKLNWYQARRRFVGPKARFRNLEKGARGKNKDR